MAPGRLLRRRTRAGSSWSERHEKAMWSATTTSRHNTVYGPAGHPRAFIDWGLAAPASPVWDLAWAANRFVPLYDAQTSGRLGYPCGRQAERLWLLCDAYGLDERDELLPTVCERIRVLYDTARTWGEAGAPDGATSGGTHAGSSGFAASATSRRTASSGSVPYDV
jgi:aminoglycoside phosphotransferase (APT) family kinase protein